VAAQASTADAIEMAPLATPAAEAEEAGDDACGEDAGGDDALKHFPPPAYQTA